MQKPPPVPAPDATRRLSGARRNLLTALGRLSGDLVVIYLGGVWVLEDPGNPDGSALAAHSFRELMEKLPKYLDVPTKARGEKLGAKVNELDDSWGRAQTSACHKNGAWGGEIDTHLSGFLSRLQAFFSWLHEHKPRRKAEAAHTLRQLDASRRGLPNPLEVLNVKAWEEMHEFFQAVAHHGKKVDRSEFDQRVGGLESFLVERLVPQTFDDLAEIDALLREGEPDA
jgi:hypothetical protein